MQLHCRASGFSKTPYSPLRQHFSAAVFFVALAYLLSAMIPAALALPEGTPAGSEGSGKDSGQAGVLRHRELRGAGGNFLRQIAAGDERGLGRTGGNTTGRTTLPVAPPAATSGATVIRDTLAPVRDKWALLVGISKFAHPEVDLKYAASDAAEFNKYLVNEAHFAADHVKLLVNEQATQRRILSELGSAWLPHVAGPDDLVVLFISTHGATSEPDAGGANYLLAHDTDPDNLYATGIEMQQIARIIKAKVHSKRVVIILDACHSGAAGAPGSASPANPARRGNIDAAKFAESSGQLVIASSLPDQESFEFQNRPSSVFTGCLLDGLRSKGEATTLGEAFAFLKKAVGNTVLRERGAMQTPVLGSAWQGEGLTLALKPASPQPALPETSPAPGADSTGLSPESPAAAAAPPPSALLVPASKESPEAVNDPLLDIEPDQVRLPPEPEPGSEPLPDQPRARRTRPPSLPDRVAVLPVSEPSYLDTGANYMKDPGVNLEYMISTKLRETLGRRLIRPMEAGTALGDVELTGGSMFSQENLMSLGLAYGARYIIDIRIEDLHFDRENNCYFSTILRIASGETGDLLLVEGKRSNCPPYKGDKSGRGQYIRTVVLPACAERICERILSVVCPQQAAEPPAGR